MNRLRSCDDALFERFVQALEVFLGPLLSTDVDDRRAAHPPVAPAVVDSDALDQHRDRLSIVQNLDLAALLGIGQQYPATEIGKQGTVFQGHELAEPLLDHPAAVQAQ